MTVYYVSSLTGSNNNAGTASGAPLATLQAAADKTKPGDTVKVMNGTYTNPNPNGEGWGVVAIRNSGTAANPITYEAMDGHHPVINASGSWAGIAFVSASYINVRGFDIVGNARSTTLAQAQAQSGQYLPAMNGSGISIQKFSDSSPISHHLLIENNTIHDNPGAGIVAMNDDYVTIKNNTVYGNANWSSNAASGISAGFSKNFDNAAGYHNVITGNNVYNNRMYIPWRQTGTISDGNGIIIDSNNANGYTARTLIQGNTAHDNGGSGIEAYDSNHVDIFNNVSYNNALSGVAPNENIHVGKSTDVVLKDNSLVAPGAPPPAPQPPPVVVPPDPTTPPDTTVTPHKLSLVLAEDAYRGNARFIVKMDGKTIGGPTEVTAPRSSGQTFNYSGDWSLGKHIVEIDFINDLWRASGSDRNLFIKEISYDGASFLKDTTPMWINGKFEQIVSS